jgi:thiosulfate reductase cytochrome b subunit
MTHPSHDADANLNASSGKVAIPGGVRHAVTVRITHWISAGCFLALLVSGVELVISHPRFYWGEEGNVNVPALFSIPIPASRGSVPTGYGYVLPDQNGWSRSLHFQTAWVVVSTGLIYLGFGLLTGHFRRNLLPAAAELSPRAFVGQVLAHLRLRVQGVDLPYNSLQRISYLGVVFGAFPFMIWTGLAMSPAVTGAFPFLVEILGGHQSARTLHFMDTLLLVLFVIVHVLMISVNGFRGRIRGMTIGERKSES